MPCTGASSMLEPAASTVAAPQGSPAWLALMWALQPYLDADRAREAAALWQPPDASGPASVMVGLSRYCRLIGQRFGLQGKEAELHLRIIRALQAQGLGATRNPSTPERTAPHASEPPNRPWQGPSTMDMARAAQPGVPGSANDSQPPGTSALVVQRFLEAVEQMVAREAPMSYNAPHWRHTLIRHAGRLPEPVLRHATDWLWGRTNVLMGDWPARGAGTRLINAAYVALAEWVGPVKADACFTRVVRDFEGSGDVHLAGVRRYL
jgi:hypothetical protein